MKYYFREYLPENEQNDYCFSKEVLLDWMKRDGINEQKVYEAKTEKNTGMFYCTNFSEIGESGESCGNICEDYKPRNGKGGICEHHSIPRTRSEKTIILKVEL